MRNAVDFLLRVELDCLDMESSSENLSAAKRYKPRYKREFLKSAQKRNCKPFKDLQLHASEYSPKA